MKFSRLMLCMAVLGICCCQGNATLVYAVSAFKPLVLLDTDTGGITVIGSLSTDSTRFVTPVGIAGRPSDGALFVDNNSPASDNGLVRVDRATGLAGVVISGDFNEPVFTPDGTLYTQAIGNSVGSRGPIGTVNLSTGAITPLSSGLLIPRLFGLAYNPVDDFFYGLTEPIFVDPEEWGNNLLKIDRTTGALVSKIPLYLNGNAVGGMVFDPAGRLTVSTFGALLYDVNPATGAVSNQRSVQNGFTPQGMTLAAIPETSVVPILGGLGVYLLASWRPNKRRGQVT
jgi:hypothetical protein